DRRRGSIRPAPCHREMWTSAHPREGLVMIAGVVDFALLADDDALRAGRRHTLHLLDELAIVIRVLVARQATFAIHEDGAVVGMRQRLAGADALQRRIDVDLALVDDFAVIDDLG